MGPKRKSLKKRFLAKFTQGTPSQCWLWTGAINAQGYGHVHDPDVGARRANRVSWEIFRGKVPVGMHVLHSCDVRACVNPNHLFLGTNLDNIKDRVKKGRSPNRRGASHPQAKLTERDVHEIRSSTASAYKLCKKYNVSPSHIYHIRWRRTWNHI